MAAANTCQLIFSCIHTVFAVLHGTSQKEDALLHGHKFTNTMGLPSLFYQGFLPPPPPPQPVMPSWSASVCLLLFTFKRLSFYHFCQSSMLQLTIYGYIYNLLQQHSTLPMTLSSSHVSVGAGQQIWWDTTKVERKAERGMALLACETCCLYPAGLW